MKENINIGTKPDGALEIIRGFGIDQLERKLSKAIAERMEPFHYDELCRIDGLSKIRAVRSEDGSIDILGTFMKARKTHMFRSGGGYQ